MLVILETIVNRMSNVKKCKEFRREAEVMLQMESQNISKQDYYWLKWSIDDRLEECWGLWKTINLSKEQYEELTVEVEDLSELLFVHLVRAMPQDTDKLKGEYDKFYAQKIPKLKELRRSCNLEPACETGYTVLSSHPEIEAERESLKEDYARIVRSIEARLEGCRQPCRQPCPRSSTRS